VTQATLDLYGHFLAKTNNPLVASNILIAHVLMGRRHSPVKPPIAMTVAEVAEQLQVSERMVYKLVKSGELTACWIGNLLRVPARSLSQFLEHRDQPKPCGLRIKV